MEKQRKKTIIGVAIAAIVIVVLVAIFAGPTIIAKTKKMVSSPESYYQWVEEKTVKEDISSFANMYDNALKNMGEAFDALMCERYINCCYKKTAPTGRFHNCVLTNAAKNQGNEAQENNR